jgi:two-component system response regulator HydG
LHDGSGSSGPFVALNCAAVPVHLLESELFGHLRGAYTDAHAAREGLFVRANGGTIFLDEIGDLPLEIQPKLLRALQERRVRPVGADKEVPFHARLITATHRDLEAMVREGLFREDLYYRVNVIKLEVPPLRDRGADVLELAARILARSAERSGRPALKISEAAAERLMAYSWPGNVRELENCMEHVWALARFEEINVSDLAEKIREHTRARPGTVETLDEVVTMAEHERRYILRVMALAQGNKSRAAQLLGLDRKTLYRKLSLYGSVEAPKPEGPSNSN